MIDGGHFRCENADFFHFVVIVGGEEFDFLPAFDGAGKNAHVGNDAAIGVIERVEDRAAQELVGVLGGMGNAFDDGFENVRNANAIFR